MHKLLQALLATGFVAAGMSAKADITYIDAVPDIGFGGNTTLNGVIFDGTNLVTGTGATNGTMQGDSKWYYRTPTATTNNGFAPNGGTFFETDGTATEENAEPLLTTITVPAVGKYKLYAMFIANTGSNTYGDIAVEVNNSGTTQFYYHNAATIPTAAPFDAPGTWIDTFLTPTTYAADSTPFPVATQWTATVYHMYLAELGEFNLANTTVNFRITGPDAKRLSDGTATFTRTLYEGVAYELVPPTAVAGDFDSDGDVDGADFVAWQTNFPKGAGATLAEGDADSDGDVDGADFVVWQTNFPFTPSPGAAAVPEPTTISLAILAGIAGVGLRRSRQTNSR